MDRCCARCGWLSHKISDQEAPRTAKGLLDVIKGVSQAGPNIPAGAIPLETVYATQYELTGQSAYIAGGNPNTTPSDEVPFT